MYLALGSSLTLDDQALEAGGNGISAKCSGESSNNLHSVGSLYSTS